MSPPQNGSQRPAALDHAHSFFGGPGPLWQCSCHWWGEQQEGCTARASHPRHMIISRLRKILRESPFGTHESSCRRIDHACAALEILCLKCVPNYCSPLVGTSAEPINFKQHNQLAKASKDLDKACCSDASVVGALGRTLTFTSSLCEYVLKSGSIMGAAGHMGKCSRRASHADVWKACGHTQRFITTGIVCIKLHELALLAPNLHPLVRMPLTTWLAVFVGRAVQSACVQGNMSCRTPAGSVSHVFLQRMSCALHGHQQCIPPVKLPSCVCEGQRDHRGPEVAVQPVRREDRLVRGRRRPV